MLNKLLALATITASASSAKITPEMEANFQKIQNEGLSADSSFGRHLIEKSRRLDQGNAENNMSFVSGYSIKFIGCHHVTQWKSQAEMEEQEDYVDEDAVLNAANGRIVSKGLVRFRLCPSDSCFDHFGLGCSSNYGEYVTDMYTFLEAYIAWQVEEMAYKCSAYRNTCYKQCYESSNMNCYSSCYKKYGVEASLCAANNGDGNGNYDQQDGYGNQFSLEDYLGCGEYEIDNENGEALANYLGPYCAQQGGNIMLGFFQDQYCSIPSAYQASYFEKLTGLEIPYTNSPIVSTNCMSCESNQQDQEAQQQQDYYNYDANGNVNYYVAKEVNEMCGTLYMQSGKCETQYSKDDVPYPEEGACYYIEAVKNLKNDGIVRGDQKISSKPASIAIGVFTGLAVLLGGYVYYLKSKIARSRVNLAGVTTSLA